MLSGKHGGDMAALIFTFDRPGNDPWPIEIELSEGKTGGAAFEEAATLYHAAFEDWCPGHPDVKITIVGKA